MAQAERKPLGEMAVEAGLITPEQLQRALETQKSTGSFIGETLIDLGFLTANDLGSFLQEQFHISYLSLEELQMAPEVVGVLSEQVVRRFNVLPIRREDNRLYVAMVDPLNFNAIQELRMLTGCQISPLVTTGKEMNQAINEAFSVQKKAAQAIEEIETQKGGAEDDLSVTELEEAIDQAPVVRLVDTVMTGALNEKASDVHLEPQKDEMRVRYRVDGVLHDQMTIPKRHQAAVVSRIKIMSGMNIAERRQPQDGHISLKSGDHEVDLRVSTIPTIFGEKIVARVLDASAMLVTLEKLGFSAEQEEIFVSLIGKPYGMILVTGPTGSGKTTTLYAALERINDPTKNIVTVEDPVEYQLAGINQIQVNPKAGVTFAGAMRHIVRQDPDIVMVGEIRDFETAEIAVQAALTGHLVFSTLHTNDAPSAVIRLVDMGVQPFLISSSATGVVAQRLARTICRNCKEPYQPPDEALKQLGITSEQVKGAQFSRGAGCRECNQSGFRGRIGVYELMKMTEDLRKLVMKQGTAEELKKVAIAEGMTTMWQGGVDKVLAGITTLDEVVRVVYAEAE